MGLRINTPSLPLDCPSCTPTPLAGTKPGAPQLTSIRAGDATLNVDFTPPSEDGGAAVQHYVLKLHPNGREVEGPAPPLLVTGLVNGKAYRVSVAAVNQWGQGPGQPAL